MELQFRLAILQAQLSVEQSIKRAREAQQRAAETAAEQQAIFEDNKRKAWGRDAIEVEAREVFDVPLIKGGKP